MRFLALLVVIPSLASLAACIENTPVGDSFVAVAADGSGFVIDDESQEILVGPDLPVTQDRNRYFVDADTTSASFLDNGDYPRVRGLSDGSRVLLLFDGGLRLLDRVTGAETNIPWERLNADPAVPFEVTGIDQPTLSADGAHVAFVARSSIYSIPARAIYVYDLVSDIFERIDVGPAAHFLDAPYYDSYFDAIAISRDGQRIAFDHHSTQDGGVTKKIDVFVRDRSTQRTIQVVPSQSPIPVALVAFSLDGNTVVVRSDIPDLVDAAHPTAATAFAVNLDSDVAAPVNLGPLGEVYDGSDVNVAISPDGRIAAFSAPGSFQPRLFLRDLTAGITNEISLLGLAPVDPQIVEFWFTRNGGALAVNLQRIPSLAFAGHLAGDKHAYLYDRLTQQFREIQVP